MGKGSPISPAVAVVIIIVVVAVAGFFIWRGTGGKKGGVDASQREQMLKYMKEKGFGTPGGGPSNAGGRYSGAPAGGR